MPITLSRKLRVLFSISLLILCGHLIAKYVKDSNYAWLWVIVFYGLWIISSIAVILKKNELKALYQKGVHTKWNFLPFLFIIPTFITIFIPNLFLVQLNFWYMANILLCLINPWIEETYWRGMINKIFEDSPVQSFMISTLGFALSHPLIFGVFAKGVEGWIGFAGAFFVGAIWWICLQKTKSLRGCVIT